MGWRAQRRGRRAGRGEEAEGAPAATGTQRARPEHLLNDGCSPSGCPERRRASRGLSGPSHASLRHLPGPGVPGVAAAPARGPRPVRRSRPLRGSRPARGRRGPVRLRRSRGALAKARKAPRAAAGRPCPPRPTPHPRRGVCPTCASCASCPCPTGPRCPPPAPGPGRAAPLPVRARRAEGGSGARETPRREAGGRRAPSGARPLSRRRRARRGRSPREAAGQRSASAAAGERARRARRVRPTARSGPWRLEVALQTVGWGRSSSRGRGRGVAHALNLPFLLFLFSSPLPPYFSF